MGWPASVTISSPAPSRSISITARTGVSASTARPSAVAPTAITSRAVSTPPLASVRDGLAAEVREAMALMAA